MLLYFLSLASCKSKQCVTARIIRRVVAKSNYKGILSTYLHKDQVEHMQLTLLYVNFTLFRDGPPPPWHSKGGGGGSAIFQIFEGQNKISAHYSPNFNSSNLWMFFFQGTYIDQLFD